MEYEILWDDAPDQEPAEPEYCGTCGRQTTFIVAWNDIEPDGVPGEGGR